VVRSCDVGVTGVLADRFDGERSSRKSAPRVDRLVASIRIRQMASLASRHTFTVHEWQEMGRVGLFDEDARVELIDGEIVDMAPIGAKHQDCVDRLTAAMVRLVGDDAVVRVQGSIRLGERSEPQPDLA